MLLGFLMFNAVKSYLEKFRPIVCTNTPADDFLNAYNFSNSPPIDLKPVSNPTNSTMPVSMKIISSRESSGIHSRHHYLTLKSL